MAGSLGGGLLNPTAGAANGFSATPTAPAPATPVGNGFNASANTSGIWGGAAPAAPASGGFNSPAGSPAAGGTPPLTQDYFGPNGGTALGGSGTLATGGVKPASAIPPAAPPVAATPGTTAPAPAPTGPYSQGSWTGGNINAGNATDYFNTLDEAHKRDWVNNKMGAYYAGGGQNQWDGSGGPDQPSGGLYNPNAWTGGNINAGNATQYFNTLDEAHKNDWVNNKMGAYYAGGGTGQWDGSGGIDPVTGAPAGGGVGSAPITNPSGVANTLRGHGGNGGNGMPGGPGKGRPEHDRTPYALANPEQRAAIEARQAEAMKWRAANPGYVADEKKSMDAWNTSNLGPNQYLDASGNIAYGYGVNDPRNSGKPLYDDPRNNINGTLGPKPGFNYGVA